VTFTSISGRRGSSSRATSCRLLPTERISWPPRDPLQQGGAARRLALLRQPGDELRVTRREHDGVHGGVAEPLVRHRVHVLGEGEFPPAGLEIDLLARLRRVRLLGRALHLREA